VCSPSEGETAATCPSDCPASCGDGTCTHAEDPCTCAGDCSASCGDTCCTHSENASGCPGDCPAVCDDGSCTHSEDACTCAADCSAVCGDTCCTHSENACNCVADCGEWGITDMGGDLSGTVLAPLHCRSDVRDGDEAGVDCGGSCHQCQRVSDAEAAVMARNHYDLHGEWAGVYVIGAVYNLVWSNNVAYMHYGYASPSAPETVLGQDSRVFTFDFNGTPAVIAMGGYLSGDSLAPTTCRDGSFDGDETAVDCGGSCRLCGEIGEAEAAIVAKNYYDLDGSWAGTYVVGAIYNFAWSGDTAHVHYGFADPSAPETILGQDSRTFDFAVTIGGAPAVTSMGAFGSATSLAPLHCRNDARDGNEAGVDCGGSCHECQRVSDAEAAVMARNYYDLHGEWAGIYVIGAVFNLV